MSNNINAPLYHSVEAFALCSVNIQAPDNSVDALAPASPVDAPSSAPFQRSVEANETFVPARSVEAHAPGDFPVDANSAPLHGSVDALMIAAPQFASVDALVPEYATVDAQIIAPYRRVA